MKKLLALFASLCMIVACRAQAGVGAIWTPQSFINGQMLYLTNNTTTTNPSFFSFLNGGVVGNNTNPFISLNGFNTLSGITNLVLSTNGTTVFTNLNQVGPIWAQYPNPVLPSILNGDVNSNMAVTIACNYTNILLAPRQNQFLTQYATPTNWFTPNASNLNVATFVFMRGASGYYGDNWMNYGTNSQDLWFVPVTNYASIGTTVITNVPVGWEIGADHMALWKIIVNSAANSQGVMVNQCFLGSMPNSQ